MPLRWKHERETERNGQPLRCTLAWKNTTCGRSPTDDSEDLGSFFTQRLPLQCSTKAAEPRQVRRRCPFRPILPQKVWLFPCSECECCLYLSFGFFMFFLCFSLRLKVDCGLCLWYVPLAWLLLSGLAGLFLVGPMINNLLPGDGYIICLVTGHADHEGCPSPNEISVCCGYMYIVYRVVECVSNLFKSCHPVLFFA